MAIGRGPRRLDPAANADPNFWLLVFLSGVAVILFKQVTHLLFLLFLRMDFTHARILVAALLPMCALVGIALWRLTPSGGRQVHIGGIILGVGLGLLLEFVATRFDGAVDHLRVDALVRIALTAIVVTGLIYQLRRGSHRLPQKVYHIRRWRR